MTRILVFGASIDHGFWSKEGGWVQILRRKLDKYSLDNEKDYSLYNLSISGDNTERILERIENEIEARDNSEEIHVYLEVGGGNDSQVELETEENWISKEEYRGNVEACIDVAEKYAEKIILFTTTPVDESKVYPMPWKDTHGYLNSEKKEYTEILREISNERELPLVDFFSKIDQEAFKERLEDGVHPDTDGHRELFEIAKEGLKERGLIPESI